MEEEINEDNFEASPFHHLISDCVWCLSAVQPISLPNTYPSDDNPLLEELARARVIGNILGIISAELDVETDIITAKQRPITGTILRH